ncbi:hypothetical protein [Salinispora cortesiana]|uniref:hypothetical protein n=1 Tax=Salinispora cortesiana TaxID=1305843 RepID=UPI0004024C55|nr:hypothetical protein [Salinispora cortesiana]
MSQKRKPSTAVVVLSAVAGALTLVLCAGLIGGLVGDDTELENLPAYTVANQEGGDIVVEVDEVLTAGQVEAIGVDLRSKQTRETSYFVSINCSTSGSATSDNRLATVRFGIGTLGSVRTGLDDGQFDVQMDQDPTCPVSASPAVATAHGLDIPPEPDKESWDAYIAELKEIDPAIVGTKDERTLISRGRSQCGSVKQWPDDQSKLVELTNLRFTAPGYSEGFGEAKAEKILAVVRTYICPTY